MKKHIESQGRSIGKNLLIRAIDYKGVYVYGIPPEEDPGIKKTTT